MAFRASLLRPAAALQTPDDIDTSLQIVCEKNGQTDAGGYEESSFRVATPAGQTTRNQDRSNCD